jgi:multimeric flavodoxin WrbA
MLVTGFMGSPRRKGNTSFLLNSFLEETKRLGADTHVVHVPDLTIRPCTGCSLCEKKGFCHFDDDMTNTVFPLLRNSDAVIIASPIYFYNVPAEMKAMIDRTQTLWSRKFKLGLKDPDEHKRKGFLLSVGATRGKDLFDSINLTMKYFFRGISTDFAGSLTYSRIEDPGEMKKHPTVEEDIRHAAENLVAGFTQKRSWVFLCRDNSLTSQMAQAFAQNLAGESLHVYSAGINPAADLNPLLVPFMAENKMDLAFRKPSGMESLQRTVRPERVILIGDHETAPPPFENAVVDLWDIPVSIDPSMDELKKVGDLIKNKVNSLFSL